MAVLSRKAVFLCLVALMNTSGFAGQVIHPEKGQSAQQQEKDRYDCYQWARNQTGVDPESLESTGPSAQAPAPGPHGGAAKGAAAGAALGTPMGLAVSAARRRMQKNEAATKQQQAQVQQQNLLNVFNRAQSVCLQGRGYRIS